MATARPSAWLPATEAAVLLALLAVPGPTRLGPSVSSEALTELQLQLGSAVRVLRIDATTHPSVVSSFHATDLPCFVLLHHGIELWRACRLPDAETILLVLRKLAPMALTPD
ncbi:hypothetical protein GCM10022409_47140 [Hymenobacter glaciei]|uniref:Thioredoxin n=1 Tax=Hymenobacter glaciei TaxID=877209 RepID=A0ABP7UWP7_9BACT